MPVSKSIQAKIAFSGIFYQNYTFIDFVSTKGYPENKQP